MIASPYARYSTDHQRQTSVEDQLRLAGERIAREGWQLGPAFTDEATSGTVTLADRPGSRALLAAALAGRFQVLVLEALDRFSRDAVDQERMIRRLEHLGVRIIGLADGYDSIAQGRELMRQIRGAINEEQVRVTGAKVHRGLTGQLARGFHAGGLSYGYRSIVAGVNAHGEPIGHRLEIHPEQADVVREIFRRFGAGESITAIAHGLNARGVPGPRGPWARSALVGSAAKGTGLLNNELYIGRQIWNRSTWRKHPDTNKWRRIERPREEWIIHERPELRILEDEIWQAARARMATPRAAGGLQGKGAKVRTLFAGLLRCGHCGGAVTAVNATRYGCVAHKDRGPAVCPGLLAPREAVDARLVSLVKDELLGPGAIAEFQRELTRQLAERTRQSGDGAATRARLAELGKEIGRLVEAIATVGISPALQDRLQRAERERAELQAHATQRKPSQAALPAAMAAYRKKVMALREALQQTPERARPALHELLGPVRLEKKGTEIWAELTAPQQALTAAGGAYLGMVAGIGFRSRKLRIS